MENLNNNRREDWLEDALKNRSTMGDIGLDDATIRAAGLVRPDEVELEQIMKESAQWESVPEEPTTEDLLSRLDDLLEDAPPMEVPAPSKRSVRSEDPVMPEFSAMGADDLLEGSSDSPFSAPAALENTDDFLSGNTTQIPAAPMDDTIAVPLQDIRENSSEAVSSDTRYFTPVQEELPEILLDAIDRKSAPTLQPAEAEIPAPVIPVSQETRAVQIPTEAQAPTEDKLEALRQRSAQRNAQRNGQRRSEPQPEVPVAEAAAPARPAPAPKRPAPAPVPAAPKPAPKTFWQKVWHVLRMGDGMFGIPHILATAVWAILIITIGTSLGRTLWLCAADVLALGKQPQETTITIDVDDQLPDVADKLHKAGLIRYPGLFQTFAEATGKGDNILVGTITFNDDNVYDYNALINAMSFKGGSTITLEVMIPEGYSCAQIFALLEEKGVCSAKALENYAAEGELDSYWFLTDMPRGHKYCLEGFMFPDTYEFYMDDDPRRVIEKFLDNFEIKFSTRMLDKYSVLRNKLGTVIWDVEEQKYRDLEFYDVIIMASIVEKEKAADLEGYTISSVFYNRLSHYTSYPYLDSDATINYAIEYYNKGELITDEQINASPYHTYKHPGLPPTPIANPGLSSLDAALEPEDTNYYYFLLNRSTGLHEFSQTLAEHERRERELGYHD